jgi:hypothetical protein
MLSAETHRTLGIPTQFVLSSLTDPSTFEGALAIAVIGALVAAIIVGAIGLARRRRRQSVVESGGFSVKFIPLSEADNAHVADLATGIGQAMMGVRERSNSLVRLSCSRILRAVSSKRTAAKYWSRRIDGLMRLRLVYPARSLYLVTGP